MQFLVKKGKAEPPWYCPKNFTPQCPQNDTICTTLAYCPSPDSVKTFPGRKKRKE